MHYTSKIESTFFLWEVYKQPKVLNGLLNKKVKLMLFQLVHSYVAVICT